MRARPRVINRIRSILPIRRAPTNKIGGVDRSVDWSVLAIALILLGSTIAGFGFAASMPSHSVPVGVVVATGPSMGVAGPELAVYSDLGSIEVGDVVIFDSGPDEAAVMHRVVGESSSGWVTRGDASRVIDQWAYPYATPENTYGEVVFRVALPGVVA